MKLVQADWQNILKVLHESYKIWSPGLTKADYYANLSRQMAHPWGRKHLRFVIHERNKTIASSCKLYDLQLVSRGVRYRILGIGAVYTQLKHRGEGCASQLITELIELARSEDYDGLLLYTEIGCEFYEQFGFELLGDADFVIELSEALKNSVKLMKGHDFSLASPVEFADIASSLPHHARWLRRQPYGIARTELYMHFKLSKEKFLHEKSKLSWPMLQIMSLQPRSAAEADNTAARSSASDARHRSKAQKKTTARDAVQESGYLLFECGSENVRMLEIIGSENAQLELWKRFLTHAVQIGAKRIRGWSLR